MRGSPKLNKQRRPVSQLRLGQRSTSMGRLADNYAEENGVRSSSTPPVPPPAPPLAPPPAPPQNPPTFATPNKPKVAPPALRDVQPQMSLNGEEDPASFCHPFATSTFFFFRVSC
ncbi:unnamed protein product [Dibothriocephalus latus]|uniref:Uncharacterized protein n=1 Tax=Dibothriocephalus latus TaxID=60516 RepID=A0A3P7LRG5_DIBLA|nr:unnamed protein product [Dibothriocephalus latus]